MAATSSADTIAEADRAVLLDVARRSIVHAVKHGRPLEVVVHDYGERLRRRQGCFVTLHLNDELRGCVGSLQPRGPLVAEVARCAYSAAMRDPRFSPVTEAELDGLAIHLSVLSPSEPIEFESEPDLLSKLRPGVDGLILRDGPCVGTFLPDVWDNLPEPRDFLAHLKRKAGLPASHWSSTLTVERYTTEGFG